MNGALEFWFAKVLVDIGVAAAILAIILIVALWVTLRAYIRVRRCKHEKVWEDRGCNIHCSQCDADLGFVGTWLEKNPERSRP